MCGFVGFTGMVEKRQEILHKMMDRIVHRGPDMADEYMDGRIALGFRRLSIIDLSENACQPLKNEDGTVVSVFNGEIYNFMELREDLLSKGHVFRTHGDSEVLVHGYEEYGEKLPEKLRGMFAFAIWDSRNGRIFGARDYFGIKPFYYTTLSDGSFLFGSEIKSFLDHPGFVPKVNPKSLRPYLTFQYSSLDETFFEGVFKLPAAHRFTYDSESGSMTVTRYWDVDFTKKSALSYDETAEQIDSRVHESVKAHRISDVKVGSFLSGGVDSSYITSVLMPDDTFSVGFGDDKKFDETSDAAELSRRLGVQNFRKMLDCEECFKAFPTIQYHMDEPQSNPSSV
ncbi:MAG: asparagine synthase (glutamine-hydrolyzing), partial [Clostridia bacterium]|nr:asparagine synthase (glutamine-hydrolyzing) [Clostridia bacterium]